MLTCLNYSNLYTTTYRLLAARAVSQILASKRTYIRGYWPEPVTQQTLDEFLKDINYLDEPKNLVNIGLEYNPKHVTKQDAKLTNKGIDQREDTPPGSLSVDNIIDLLGKDSQERKLDPVDFIIESPQIKSQAFTQCIYRDLFIGHIPSNENIKFTKEQAERLNKLIPYYWITDMPFARVDRSKEAPKPFYYFDPIVSVNAKFIEESSDSNDCTYAHSSYFGNYIRAADALSKPSIAIDCRSLLTETDSADLVHPEDYNNFNPGEVRLFNTPQSHDSYFTLVLVNLDYLHQNESNLHWLITNINNKDGNICSYDEACDYLPVHGINGFGYSRYVFLLLKHKSKIDVARIDSFMPEARKFSAHKFLDENKDKNIQPVGLSWFQTSWDESSTEVFHDFLKMKSPCYEYVQPTPLKTEDKPYPGRIPFNSYIDLHKDPKDINKRVLLERLKIVSNLDYKNQYEIPELPETVFEPEKKEPDWMYNIRFKKNNKLSYWRGLRPASASIPLNNNADLDFPIRPNSNSKKAPPSFPMTHPAGYKVKPIFKLGSSKPANEYQEVFVQDDQEHNIEEAKRMLKK